MNTACVRWGSSAGVACGGWLTVKSYWLDITSIQHAESNAAPRVGVQDKTGACCMVSTVNSGQNARKMLVLHIYHESALKKAKNRSSRSQEAAERK